MAAAVRLTCGPLEAFDQRRLRGNRVCRCRQDISMVGAHSVSQGTAKARSDGGHAACRAANVSHRGGMATEFLRSSPSVRLRGQESAARLTTTRLSDRVSLKDVASLDADHPLTSQLHFADRAHLSSARRPHVIHRSVGIQSSLSSPTKGAATKFKVAGADPRSYASEPSFKPRHLESPVSVKRPSVKKGIYKGLEDSPSKVEMCCIVDEDNNVVGQATRADTVGRRLWGRGVYCLVQNTRGQLLVTQRTEEKDLYPGHLDVVVSGCVNVGEEYSDTVVRELSEELGLQYVDRSALTPLFLFKWVDEYCRIWGCGYHYVTDSETFNLQVEEVQWCKWMDLDQVEALIQTARFTPVGLCVLRRFLRERQLALSQ